MMARARVTCWIPSARVKSFWLIGPTTVTLFEGFDGPWRLGQRQANATKVQHSRLQPVSLLLPQLRRAVLQQDQTLQSGRNLLRKARPQLSRRRQTGRCSCLDALYESVTKLFSPGLWCFGLVLKRPDRPSLTHVFVGCPALQGLEPPCAIVGQQKGMEMLLLALLWHF
jgi:hypothetical protein